MGKVITKFEITYYYVLILRVFCICRYIQNIAPSNDLAIIELNRPVYVYGNHVRTLCLPSQRIPQPTDECFVTGFGKLSKLFFGYCENVH